MAKPTVYLFEHDRQLRSQTEAILRDSEIAVQVCSSWNNFFEVYKTFIPCCLVLGFGTGEFEGIALVEQLRLNGYCPPYLLVSPQRFRSHTGRPIAFGSFDFFEMPGDSASLVARIDDAFILDHEMRSRYQARVVTTERIDALTAREREVISLVLDGKLSKQVAKQLEISVKTVEAHRSNITRKMRADSFIQAACAFNLAEAYRAPECRLFL